MEEIVSTSQNFLKKNKKSRRRKVSTDEHILGRTFRSNFGGEAEKQNEKYTFFV